MALCRRRGRTGRRAAAAVSARAAAASAPLSRPRRAGGGPRERGGGGRGAGSAGGGRQRQRWVAPAWGARMGEAVPEGGGPHGRCGWGGLRGTKRPRLGQATGGRVETVHRRAHMLRDP